MVRAVCAGRLGHHADYRGRVCPGIQQSGGYRSRTTPATAMAMLARLTKLAGHVFWPDSVRYVTGDWLDRQRVVGYRQVTDAHLLAVAAANHGRLVTLDARIGHLAEPGSATLEVIPTSPVAAP